MEVDVPLERLPHVGAVARMEAPHHSLQLNAAELERHLFRAVSSVNDIDKTDCEDRYYRDYGSTAIWVT